MSQHLSYLKQSVKTNPISFMGLVCLMLCGVFYQGEALTVSPALPFAVAFCVAIVAAVSVPSKLRVVTIALGIGISAWGFVRICNATYPAVALLTAGAAGLIGILAYWWITGQLTAKRVVFLLIAGGFLLRLCYVLYTPVWVRQHDVWYFTYGPFEAFTDQRHAQYIEYIATYLELPSVNPTEVGLSQLYHPPLHHLIAGLWLRLNMEAGISYWVAYENIQFLTLFYSAACMVIVYRILRLLSCKRWGLILPMAVICFHPTFIIMAGSINNDLLSVTLAFYAVYAALRWYKTPTFYHIVTVALGVGLSMMTKLSGGLVAPGIAVLFLWKWADSLCKKDGKGRNLFFQFAVFGIVCVPLALWWQVKNAVTYDIPLTFVPALDENSGQYLGEYTTTQRLFALPKESLSRIFMAWDNEVYQSSYNEYSMLLSLLKTSVFGEFTLFVPEVTHQAAVCAKGVAMSHLLFWSNLGLTGLSLYAGVRCLIRWKNKATAWGLFLIWAMVFISYIQFCLAYPQACTQNFRYAVPTLLCGLIALGAHLNHSSKVFKGITTACTAVFCVACVGVYTLLGMV